MKLVYCGHQNKLCPKRVARVPKEVNNETNLRVLIAFGSGNTAHMVVKTKLSVIIS